MLSYRSARLGLYRAVEFVAHHVRIAFFVHKATSRGTRIGYSYMRNIRQINIAAYSRRTEPPPKENEIQSKRRAQASRARPDQDVPGAGQR